jgi:flagellar basal body-associated protein FliL
MEKYKSPKRKSKAKTYIILFLILALGTFVFVRYYFVFGTGVKSGELNYLVNKGVVFKTYEGKLIQTGFRADKPEGFQSNQFEFSISDKALAEELMKASGKNVQLHYKEYFGAIPWRGFTKFIVDEIISVDDAKPNSSLPYNTVPD